MITEHCDEVAAHLGCRCPPPGFWGCSFGACSSPRWRQPPCHPQKDGDVRPIAVGECLRRLIAKCLCQAYKEEATSALWPLQLGVAAPLGCESLVCTVHEGLTATWAMPPTSSSKLISTTLSTLWIGETCSIDTAIFQTQSGNRLSLPLDMHGAHSATFPRVAALLMVKDTLAYEACPRQRIRGL